MAPVDPTTIYAVTAGIVLLVILIVTLISKFSSAKSNDGDKANEGVAAPAANRQAVAGPGGVRRRGPRVNRMRANRDDSDDSQEEDDLLGDTKPEGKIGVKKMRKLQEKAERKAMREQEEKEREERKKREKELDAKRMVDEERQKKDEAEKEEEERLKKEEQERIDHEEYLKMKEMFTVDEEGEQDQDANLENESLLAQFINYIKETKVVMLEDLAGHFKLKTQDVILRVQDLQADGTLTGVIDDRGKFIYITQDELEAVARYIRQNGRVSISDLAASSNRLINLDPDLSAMVRKVTAEVGDIVEGEEQAVGS